MCAPQKSATRTARNHIPMQQTTRGISRLQRQSSNVLKLLYVKHRKQIGRASAMILNPHSTITCFYITTGAINTKATSKIAILTWTSLIQGQLFSANAKRELCNIALRLQHYVKAACCVENFRMITNSVGLSAQKRRYQTANFSVCVEPDALWRRSA